MFKYKIIIQPKGSLKNSIKDSFLFALIIIFLTFSNGLADKIYCIAQEHNKHKTDESIRGSLENSKENPTEKTKHNSINNSYEKGNQLFDFLSELIQTNQKKSHKLFQKLCRGQVTYTEIKALTMNDFFLASHSLNAGKKNQNQTNENIMLNNQWLKNWNSCKGGLRKIFIFSEDNQIKKEIIYWMWQQEPVWAHGFFQSQLKSQKHDSEIEAILALAEQGTRIYPFAVRLRKEKNLLATIKAKEFFHYNGIRYPTAIHLLRYKAVPILLKALENPSAEIRLYALNALPYLKTDYNQKEVLRKTLPFLKTKKFLEKDALEALRVFYEK